MAKKWRGSRAPDPSRNRQKRMTYDKQCELDRTRRERLAG